MRMSEKEVRERVCAHLGEGNLSGRCEGMRDYVHKQENECARGSIRVCVRGRGRVYKGEYVHSARGNVCCVR